MENFFTFRLDSMTKDKLGILAKQTQRSRGGVIRWLILNANVSQLLVTQSTFDIEDLVSKDLEFLPSVENERELSNEEKA